MQDPWQLQPSLATFDSSLLTTAAGAFAVSAGVAVAVAAAIGAAVLAVGGVGDGCCGVDSFAGASVVFISALELMVFGTIVNSMDVFAVVGPR